MLITLSNILAAQTNPPASNLPDAPSQVKSEERKKAGFWTFGDSLSDKPLRGTKETLTSKVFVVSHSLALAAIVFDVEATHQGLAHHKCVEGNTSFSDHPSRGELYKDNLIIFAALTGMDFLYDKYAWKPLSLIHPAGEIYVHVKGGASWFTDGCF